MRSAGGRVEYVRGNMSNEVRPLKTSQAIVVDSERHLRGDFVESDHTESGAVQEVQHLPLCLRDGSYFFLADSIRWVPGDGEIQDHFGEIVGAIAYGPE